MRFTGQPRPCRSPEERTHWAASCCFADGLLKGLFKESFEHVQTSACSNSVRGWLVASRWCFAPGPVTLIRATFFWKRVTGEGQSVQEGMGQREQEAVFPIYRCGFPPRPASLASLLVEGRCVFSLFAFLACHAYKARDIGPSQVHT